MAPDAQTIDLIQAALNFAIRQSAHAIQRDEPIARDLWIRFQSSCEYAAEQLAIILDEEQAAADHHRTQELAAGHDGP